MASSQYLAANIRRLQGKKTCAEFAKELGVSKTTLNKLRRSGEHFSSTTLEHVAASLGVTVSDLLSGPPAAIPDALILTVGAFACTSTVGRERAAYHMRQLVDILSPGARLWMENGV